MRLCSNIGALSRAIFNGDVVVVSNVELLSGRVVVALLNFEPLTVSELGSKVDAVLDTLVIRGGYSDLGAASSVSPSLEADVFIVVRNASGTGEI